MSKNRRKNKVAKSDWKVWVCIYLCMCMFVYAHSCLSVSRPPASFSFLFVSCHLSLSPLALIRCGLCMMLAALWILGAECVEVGLGCGPRLEHATVICGTAQLLSVVELLEESF